ncbi:uncharacterized protein LOC115445670 [Manduca sexta]|uniref:Uncharacterized protein n=1 Tax=Manduca sexta TaxID=7130 RepID=A0A921Z8V3_MANSE|nr:uncharacterized protein LOC115445670 [Manduca sexta]KAG6453493.1 hypothetical protein O3G_MSEX008205 [Manduca sexta]
MSQRVFDTTKWLWYLLLIQVGLQWTPVRCVTVRTPPSNPSTIEAQAKFFQDFFSVQLSPYKIEFGHVCEDPDTWEQRYEKKDFKNHRDMGKVRWGDKKGGYGEHYWDLNHAGHVGNHGNDDYESDADDGSYHENDHKNTYDEPSGHTYGTEEYDPERSSYEENGRAKRAHPLRRIVAEKKEKVYEGEVKPQKKRNSETQTAAPEDADYPEDEETYVKPRRNQQRKEQKIEDHKPKSERNQVVLVVTKNDEVEKTTTELPKKLPDVNHYVPYEGGAGVRQHHKPDISAAVTVPRLFLEPSTGHVVDRATGQAYVLQPIAINRYN